jgi:hypothetical protein
LICLSIWRAHSVYASLYDVVLYTGAPMAAQLTSAMRNVVQCRDVV